MRYLIIFICLLLTACSTETQLNNSDQTTATATPISEQTNPLQSDITFIDFHIQPELTPFRELKSDAEGISYILYEFHIADNIQAIDQWLRDESKRLDGKVIERYSYNIFDAERLDLIIVLPSSEGTRLLSSYVQQYLGEKYLILIETTFSDVLEIDANYEDHALVISVPQPNQQAIEIFKGMYPHQHTDIFSFYFYSEAYLLEVNKHTSLLNGQVLTSDDYVVGYFDKDGKEISVYDIPQDRFDEYTFGIQIRSSFLPSDKLDQEQLLFHWAKTLLIGDRAHSYANEDGKVHFLKDGEVFKSYSIADVST